MKAFLIHNFTKRSHHLVAAFLHKHGLYNAHALVAPDAFTDDVVKLCIRFGLNVILTLDGVEEHHNSVVEVEKRNPGFEARVTDFPRHKIEILRRSTRNLDTENLIGLALSWPELRVRAVRSHEAYDAFGEEMHLTRAYMEQNQDHAEQMNIVWGQDIYTDFQLFDFDLAMDLGLVGATECLVMTK